MENQTLLLQYLIWGFVILSTKLIFDWYSKKKKTVQVLVVITLISTWILTAIVQGFIYWKFDVSQLILTPYGFVLLFMECLPVVALFGGTAFFYKYRKMKKEEN